MTTPSLPDQADEPTRQQSMKPLAFVAGAVVLFVVVMVVLHLTGVVG